MFEKEVAHILLGRKAVKLNAAEPFTYSSGIKSPIYCDNRVLISYPTERDLIVDYFVKLIDEKGIECDVIAGTATAGIPWAAFIAQKLGKPMIYIKKEAKQHGTQKLIEGDLLEGQKVLVVEDLISTGGSSLKAVLSVRESKGNVTDCIAIFTYEMQKAIDNFKENNCELHTLSNFSALVDVAAEDNYLKPEEKETVLAWNKDPENWGT